ncbi:MAG: AAA family ATPase [Alphaproteobacteria bacterium]|nr:AAA family ATPase [Alphaproteobacteria bacterium]
MTIPFADSIANPTAFKTGTFVDKLSGIGGIPKGYITELWGRSGVGKSTLALQMASGLQKNGVRCLWVDVEVSYTPLYADKLGVNSSKLGLYRDTFAEDILDTIEDEVSSGNWDVIFLDSVGALMSRAEAEKRSGEVVIASQGKLIAPWVRKVVPQLILKGVSIVIVNHAKQDLMSGTWQPSAGEKLVYHKAFSVYLKYAGETIKQGENKIGEVITAEVKKNKVAATKNMKINGHFIYGSGFNTVANLLEDAMEAGVITKKGNTLFFGEEKLGIGLQRVRKAIEEDADLSERIKQALACKNIK